MLTSWATLQTSSTPAFNMLGSSEGAWVNMTAAGNGQAFDVAGAPGEWRDNAGFIELDT